MDSAESCSDLGHLGRLHVVRANGFNEDFDISLTVWRLQVLMDDFSAIITSSLESADENFRVPHCREARRVFHGHGRAGKRLENSPARKTSATDLPAGGQDSYMNGSGIATFACCG